MLEYRIGNFDRPGTRRVRRVLQTGDLHLQDKLLDRQRPVLQWIDGLVRSEGIDLVCITGDIAGWHVPHRASDAERNEFARFVFGLAMNADVVVAMGNHDIPSNWEWLGEGWAGVSNQVMDRIHFVDRPTSLRFGDFRLQVMTYPAKHWVGAGADGEGDLRAAVTEAAEYLGGLVGHLVSEPDGDPVDDKVFYTGHHGTIGATYGSRPAPSVEAENFTPEQVLATGCHAAGFNHIHLPQRGFLVDGVAGHHVGAPYHLTFGDEGRRGVGVWSFEGAVPEYQFHQSPSEPWVTVTGRWNGEGWDLDDVPIVGASLDKVRVRLTWSEGDNVDVAAALEQLGVKDAKVELTVEKRDAPAVQWDHSATLMEQFATWCRDARGREPTNNELGVVSKAAGEVEGVG